MIKLQNIEFENSEHKNLNSFNSSNFKRIYVNSVNVIIFLSGVIFIFMFLPWTQNINGKGKITTLNPQYRPQKINSIIPGRIEKWYVNEGDFVKKGDTILFLSEIKDDYLDPNLIDNTKKQLQSKELKVSSYMEKIIALDKQIDALIETNKLKLEQAENKLKQANFKLSSDSISLLAAETDLSTSKIQLERTEKLFEQGLKSKTDLENKKQEFQVKESKYIEAKNKLLTSRNEIINAQIEINSIDNVYLDKIFKAESEKYATLSTMYESEVEVTKMQNQYVNYTLRSGMYFILAPLDGYITRAIKNGIGETVKEGTELMTIMPSNYILATELYVEPYDIPLISKGQEVRLIFDGWPSIIFSGWPGNSYGTFEGKVYAVDNFTDSPGKFRLLIEPFEKNKKWPKELKINSGAVGYILLKDVPIWYELWRQFNGFPPDFYENNNIKLDNNK